MLHKVLAGYPDQVEQAILQFPHLSSFPHHKHLPKDVIASAKPTIGQVLLEILQTQN